MLSNKIENLITFIVFVVILAVLRLIFPGNPEDIKIQMQYAVVSFLSMVILYVIYVRNRNKAVMNRIQKFKEEKNITDCIKYLNKNIDRQPKLFWIKYAKLMLLAECGRVVEYKAYKTVLLRDAKITRHVRKNYLPKIDRMEVVLNYMCDALDTVNYEKVISESPVDRAYNLIVLINADKTSCEIVEEALYLFNSDIDFYKSFASVILSIFYKNKNDEVNTELYKQTAIKYAPSDEFLELVEVRILRQ